MADSINNWVHEKTVSDASLKAAERARKVEHQRERKGWRYVTIDSRTKILVPCDKDGNPTKKGKEMIAEVKQKCLV